MKKSISTVAACLLLMFIGVSAANAQFSVGAELGLPSGNFSDFASTGFGGSVSYDATISDKLGWTASIGYLSFGGKTIQYNSSLSIPFGATSNIPLNGGVKYYFSEAGNGFYGGLDLSLNFLSVSYLESINNGNNGSGYTLGTQSETKFGINPGIGYRLSNLDFAFRYNAVGDFSYLGIRAAYVFGGK